MKAFEETKVELEKIIKQVMNEIFIYIPETMQKKYSEDLLEDLQNEFYIVVILGEFKRGKSTFANSLLGENLLPVDVTPTTATINAMLWNEERQMSVYGADGTIETLELNSQYLKKYIAGADFDPNLIKYLKIGIPAEILKNKVVLVDTPGVDDLNEQRVDVTYKFIPRADAVLFLLDATSPVRRTEKEFIEDNLLSSGIEKILFIANFVDRVDEEEKEETIEYIANRLRAALGGTAGQVFGISAWQALKGKIDENSELIKQSGILEVENAIKKLIETGSQTEEKLNRYKKRTMALLDAVERDINTAIQMETLSVGELNSELDSISAMISEEKRRKIALDEYVRRQENEIVAIVHKSVSYFGDQLRNDLFEEFEGHKGEDFKEFIEKKIPKTIKRKINIWIQQNKGAISKMFQMLQNELAIGLARHFNNSLINFKVNKGFDEIDGGYLKAIEIEAEDISRTPLVAGILAAAASSIATLLAGPILTPFVGYVGFKIIQEKMLGKKLSEVKDKLRPKLDIALDKVIINFSSSLNKIILNKTAEIKNACSITYDEFLNSIRLRLQREIEEKQELRTNSQDRINNLRKSIDSINKFRDILEQGGN